MAYQHNTLKYTGEAMDLADIHLSDTNRSQLETLVEEFQYSHALKTYDIPMDNKILLHGHTGCGKTATAHAIAKTLNKKIITLNLGGFVSSRLGETGKNITEVFKNAAYDKAVLFIDEFDFIGKVRDYDSTDSGEMKRLVNTLIQQIDALPDSTLLIGATNHVQIIDTALLRRFQIRLQYDLPSRKELDVYYDRLLEKYPDGINTVTRTYGCSYAEVKDLVLKQVKSNIIQVEKNRVHKLFEYGTPQFELFLKGYQGDVLEKSPASLKDYTIREQVIRGIESGDDCKNMHPIAIKTKDTPDVLYGEVYTIRGRDLVKMDALKPTEYKRILGLLDTGEEAWIYVSKNIY